MALVVLTVGAACGGDDEKTSSGHEMGAMPAETQPAAFARLDPATFADHMQDKDAVLINVHIPYEGEIEQTDAFIPYDKILGDTRLPQDKSKEILLYCRTGRMSEEAGAALNHAGYTKVAHLEGGMKAWEASGHKLIQNPAHAS